VTRELAGRAGSVGDLGRGKIGDFEDAVRGGAALPALPIVFSVPSGPQFRRGDGNGADDAGRKFPERTCRPCADTPGGERANADKGPKPTGDFRGWESTAARSVSTFEKESRAFGKARPARCLW